MTYQRIGNQFALQHISRALHRRVIPDGDSKPTNNPYAPARSEGKNTITMSVASYFNDLEDILKNANDTVLNNLAGLDLRKMLLNHPRVQNLLHPTTTPTPTPYGPPPSLPYITLTGVAIGCLVILFIVAAISLWLLITEDGCPCDSCCCRCCLRARSGSRQPLSSRLMTCWTSCLKAMKTCVSRRTVGPEHRSSPSADANAGPVRPVTSAGRPSMRNINCSNVTSDGGVDDREPEEEETTFTNDELEAPLVPHGRRPRCATCCVQ